METIVFSGFGIDIVRRPHGFAIRYDGGEIADRIVEDEITEEEAMRAQRSERDAYEVILVGQNRRSP